ncbi:MAG: isoaspartyl peptidase/L-asparaginase [Cyclobacteriaceae bacterium]
MKLSLLPLFALLFLASCTKTLETAPGPITLVIHGGAGTIQKANMTPEKEAACRAKLTEALQAGYSILESGGNSTDAVIAAIKVMEDSPLFNAGKGAVFTHDGKNEMDAAIMEGQSLMAGAVAGITNVRNPITAAHAVMAHSEHVMMTGKGAEQFAAEQGLEIVDPSYFFDSVRFRQLQKALEGEQSKHASYYDPMIRNLKFGTVGAVALDSKGNITAGTSTGGMTNKRYGRVGDAPIIGAGTYANNQTCGLSATGHGEYFIRAVVGHEVSSLMAYGGLTLQQATDSVVMKKLVRMGGEGGLVALDRQGNVSMTFNSEGMYRGFIQKGTAAKTFIYRE